ncbi:glycosyltransferase [Paenibacillus whitsoniae]|uniref:Glycosyltransferase n=1 Tax=Paenibacillus whitsoniae TaxID=2496558 RepID=A0A3S0A9L4_9BACL|nr:glycosyltransferase [Paenibacillus whitsoniae]RTE07919.1 glycosyltransferase [Paenibacillus whitsoniae]
MSDYENEPLVSIGLPVYNGEKYLQSALESLLSQDYRNIEIIISDNGSEDSTEDICKSFLYGDSRIHYYRNDTNIGGIQNFKKVLELSSGEYFMWAAHDDLREPQFVRDCVKQLENNPTAVMCMSDVLLIDSEGKTIKEFEVFDTRGKSISENIIEWITRFWWYEIYGLIRRKDLSALDISREEFGIDVIWVLELMLRGQILRVDKKLFQYRQITKPAEENVNAITSDEQRRLEISSMPWTQFARNLYLTIESSDLEAETKSDILGRMTNVFSKDYQEWKNQLYLENLEWCNSILIDSDYIEEFLYLRLTSMLSVEQILARLSTQSLDKRLKEISKCRPIMIWGTGSVGENVYQELSLFNIKVSGFLDSNLEKNGVVFNRTLIHSPEILGVTKSPSPFVIIASSYAKEISTNLIGKGYEEKKDFITKDINKKHAYV